MSERAWDRILIHLSVLGPLLLAFLTQWQSSLNGWYTPIDSSLSRYFGAHFEQQVTDWIASSRQVGPALIVIADRDCPCTKISLQKLEAAIQRTPRRNVRLEIEYLHEAASRRDPAWNAILAQIPATPTLLAIDGKRLLYAGPLTSGAMCTSTDVSLPGVNALLATTGRPIVNWLANGCYCPLRQQAPPGSNASASIHSI